MTLAEELERQFGRIDIYLLDQIMRGRVRADMRILDAGCGGGRNSAYLLGEGADLFGVDADVERVRAARALALRLAGPASEERFEVADIRALPFEDRRFDAVICSAVLHFAADEGEFDRMLTELWRVLADGGVLFTRLATTIGLEASLNPEGPGWHRLPDGTDRFLVGEADLLLRTRRLGGTLLDPIKTTNVQGLRAMTTWVLAKS